MGTSLVVAIIAGLFGAVVGPIMSYLLRLERMRHAVTHERALDRRPMRSVFITVAVGAACGGFVGYFALAPAITLKSTTSPRVAILVPSAASQVSKITIVHGTATGVPAEHDLWLLVLPVGTTQYYPQPGPVPVGPDGKWAASVYIGNSDSMDVGRQFVIVAALADRGGTGQFTAYLEQVAREGRSPGIDPLPPSVRPASEITVVRK